MKNILAVAVCAAGTLAACADGATYRKEKITLPTYVPGGYEKTPLFYTGRVYQGAQGRIYPYPAQDVLHDDKRQEEYLYLTLENDWLQMGVLPEHGGHLLNLTDKQTGYEAFYRQHVIKPALIGTEYRGVQIYSMDDLEKYLGENKADIAVLTVPKTAAVPVTERLTASGIDAIWNFTNVELTEPNSSTIVENVHFSDSLLSLSYFVAERRDEAAAKAAREEK